MNAFLTACSDAIGGMHVISDPHDMGAYLTDWRGRETGIALAVLQPSTTQDVAALVRLCNQYRVPVVPQGGNTGLVLGSIPDRSGTAVVMSLKRLNQIRDSDAINNTMTVEAGCILQQVQTAATAIDRLFPLSLAAQGSCTIGGNLSTNAGGTAVLRYGSMRELCLGLEVVTAHGDIWSSLRGLRKDNTGYDLRDLYIGAEGTLGIITAAVLKLFPRPKATVTALAAVATPEDALQFLSLAQQSCGASLTAFELMSHFCLQLVTQHFDQLRLPMASIAPNYVLLELSDHESEAHAATLFEQLIGTALERNQISDAVIATSLTQSAALWSLREHIPLAQAKEGKNIKHDISVPISRIGDFIMQTDALLLNEFLDCRMVTFGHLGDGNLHYNVSPGVGQDGDALLASQSHINRIVHDSVDRFGGSISAEHGIGAQKRDDLRRYTSTIELQLMQQIKTALDPLNLMNPGKII
jgi:FAD/FMN-containing dehydrogenase